jgi:hypothetical protein
MTPPAIASAEYLLKPPFSCFADSAFSRCGRALICFGARGMLLLTAEGDSRGWSVRRRVDWVVLLDVVELLAESATALRRFAMKQRRGSGTKGGRVQTRR